MFFLFHRPRLWNPKQSVWMGWERKRGKLAQFNKFLRGEAQMRSARSSATRATLVRPLRNHARLRHRIAARCSAAARWDDRPSAEPRALRSDRRPRYGGLWDHPAARGSLPHQRTRSFFAAIHSGHPGVDPYTTAVSDVYQDLFAEGSFTGKGIYEVDAFEDATHGRFPENTLLSHDLIEGT